MLSGVRVPSTCNSMCLYTQHDAQGPWRRRFALERVVGHERVKSMLTSAPGKVFVYS
ncbi:unnamed protein product [Effrenium voratum]|nr:unnamed protein product [Effrenium voratum]